MKVIYKPTGQTGTIPDDKFDPALFSQVSGQDNTTPVNANPAATTQPVPTIDSTTPASSNNNLVDKVADWLPTIGAIGGGALGSLTDIVDGPLGTIGGAAGGGALGEGLKEKIEGQNLNPGDIATQAALAGAGEGVGGILAKLGGKLATKEGADLISSGVNATKRAANKYQDETGEEIADTLMHHNLAGADASDISSAKNALQNTFDSVAENSTAPVDPNIFLENAASRINSLKSSTVPSTQRLGDAVDQALGNIVDKYGDSGLTIKDLTNERRAFDDATSKSQFASDQWGVNRTVGDVLRDTVQQSADAAGLSGPGGQSLKGMGLELSKLYKLEDLAKARAGIGKGPNLLHAGAAALLGHLIGGNPLLFGSGDMALEQFLANPAVAGKLGKTAIGMGKSMQNGILQKGAQLAGAGLGSGAAALGSEGQPSGSSQVSIDDQNQTGEQNVQSNSPSATDNTTMSNNYQLTSPSSVNVTIPQDYPEENYLKDLQKFGGNPIMQEAATRAYQASQDRALQYAETHGIDPEGKNFMQITAPDMINKMSLLKQLIQKKGTGPLNDNPIVQYIKSQTDPEYAQMLSLMTQLKGEATKANVGGRLSNYDVQRLNTMPTPGDSTDSAIAKLDQQFKVINKLYNQLLPSYALSTYANMPNTQNYQLNQPINPAGGTMPPIGAELQTSQGGNQLPTIPGQ